MAMHLGGARYRPSLVGDEDNGKAIGSPFRGRDEGTLANDRAKIRPWPGQGTMVLRRRIA